MVYRGSFNRWGGVAVAGQQSEIEGLCDVYVLNTYHWLNNRNSMCHIDP